VAEERPPYLTTGWRGTYRDLTPEQMLERAEMLEAYFNGLPDGVISEAWAEAQNLRRYAAEAQPGPQIVQVSVEFREVDVTVLRLRPGDVLIGRIPDEWFDGLKLDGDLADHARDQMIGDFLGAMEAAFKKAGVESVGQVYTTGAAGVQFTIVRTDEEGASDAGE
jgi:hypothetical protein